MQVEEVIVSTLWMNNPNSSNRYSNQNYAKIPGIAHPGRTNAIIKDK
jgi:hypothetical protein